MATAMKKVRKIQAAVKATVETLESRTLLAAGQLDWSFNPGQGFFLGTGNDALLTYNPANADLSKATGPTQTDSTNIIHDVAVDGNGNIVVVGQALGNHYITTGTNPVIIHDQDFYVARYGTDGTLNYITAANTDRTPGDRDLFTNSGGAYPVANNTAAYDDYARAVAIDPTDNSIVVVGTYQLAGSAQCVLAYARYFPGSQVAGKLETAIRGPGLPWSVNDVAIYNNTANPADPLNGKIYIVGSVGQAATNQDAAIWRLNANGTLDTTFGQGGHVYVNGTGTSSDLFNSIAIEPATLTGGVANPNAGKIVCVGYSDESTNTTNGVVKYVVRRFNSDGTIDSSFGLAGKTQLEDFGGKNARGVSVAIQADGQIVTMGVLDNNPFIDAPAGFDFNDSGNVAGYDTVVVARLTGAGMLDTSFGSRGVQLIGDPAGTQAFIGQSMTLEADGKIMVAGTIGTAAQTIRLTTSGGLDSTYGTNGFAQLGALPSGLFTQWDNTLSLASMANGKTVLAANIDSGGLLSNGPWELAVIQTDSTAPVANLLANDITVPTVGPTKYSFIVTYSDSVLVSQESLLASNVEVVAPDGTIYTPAALTPADIAPQSTSAGDIDGLGKPDYQKISVRYTITIPGGWNSSLNGAWTIRLKANQVKNAETNPANEVSALARDLGRFNVGIFTPDTTAPTFSFDYFTGTATGGTATSLVDTNANWSAGEWIGKQFRVTAGTGLGSLVTVLAMGKSSPLLTHFDTLIYAAPGFTADATTQFAFNDIYPGITVGGRTQFIFHVYYTDPLVPPQLQSEVNVALLSSMNLLVTGPSGYSQLATFLGVDVPTNGNPRVATYSIPAPSGVWNITNNGLYQIHMQPNQVADTAASPNYIQAGLMGQFNVAIIPGSDVRPTATFANSDGSDKSVFDTLVNPANNYQFYVHYRPSLYATPGVTLDLTTIVNNNVAVQGSSLSPAFTGFAKYDPTFTPLADGSGGYTVRYTITNASGKWTSADNGTYNLAVLPNEIADRDQPANFVPLTQLGNFSLNIQQFATSTIVAPTALSTNYSVTVSFINGFVPNPAAIGNGNVTVTGPLGALTPLDTTINVSGTVTYRFNAPNGIWDSRANGAWTVAIVNGQISGLVGATPVILPDISLGGFNFAYNPPLATLVGVSAVAVGPADVVVTVQYTGVLAIDQTSILNGNLSVQRTDGGPALVLAPDAATPPVITPGAGNTITVAYSFKAPNNYWTSNDNGTYTVSLNPNQVRNTSGQAASAVTFAPPFMVALVADTQAPTAAVTQVTNVTTMGVSSLVFQVTYTDNTAVDFSTIGSNNITVIDAHGNPYVVTLVAGSVTPAADAGTITALYRLVHTFVTADNGTWSITMNDGTVADVSGNTVPAGAFGSFLVQVKDNIPPTVSPGTLPAPLEDTTTYQVTVVFNSPGGSGIDLTTIDANDLRVTRSDGLVLASGGAPAYVSLAPGNVSVQVTYTFAAPGGTWNFQDVGTYTVRVQAGEIKNMSGTPIAAATVGTFTYTDLPPVATLQGIPLPSPILGTKTYSFTVEYTDEAAINAATFTANNLLVTRVSGGPAATLVSAGAPVVQQVSLTGNDYLVTYTFNAPGGFWLNSVTQTWAIQLLANQVADAGGDFSTGASLGTLVVPPLVDNIAPTAVVTPAQVLDATTSPVTIVPPTVMGGTYDVTVIYSDNVAVDVTTINAGNIIVSRTAGGPATSLVSSAAPTINPAANGTPITVTYHFKAPVGNKNLNEWDHLANGTWSVSLSALAGSVVKDISGNSIAATTLGRFIFVDKAPQATAVAPTDITAATTNNWDLTVNYTDDGAIDLTTITAANVSAQRTNVGSVPLVLVSAGAPTITANATNTQVTAVYHFLAPATPNSVPAGELPTLYWQWLNDGVYTFTLNSAQVKDTGGQAAAGAPLAAGVVNIPTDQVLPTVTVTEALNVVAAGAIQYAFRMNVQDNVAVDVNSLLGGPNIDLVSPSGTHYSASLMAIVAPGTTAPSIGTMYQLDVPHNFTTADNGLWLISVRANTIFDVSGNAASAQAVGSFNVNVPADPPPTVTNVTINTPLEDTTTYSVTVEYDDAGTNIDLTSISATNVSVTRSLGGTALSLTSSGAPTVVSLDSADTQRVLVTYQFNAPGAMWNFQAVGTWSVSMLANQVKNINGKFVAAGEIGTFTYSDTFPTATLTDPAPSVSAAGTANLSVRINYVDPDGGTINAATFSASNIIVRGLLADGSSVTLTSAGAPVVQKGDAQGDSYFVTYTFLPLNGYWQGSTSNGTYTVLLVANQVADTGGNFSPGGVVGSPFTVALPVDTAPPTATLLNASAITSPTNTYSFTIRFQDDTGMDLQSIGAGNVIVTAPDGTIYPAAFVSMVPNAVTHTLDVTYSITRATNFDASVNGSYIVSVVAGQVKDIAGNAMDTTVLLSPQSTTDNPYSFLVACAVPPVTASLGGTNSVLEGSTTLQFTVTFSSSTYPLDVSTIIGNNSAVVVTGPNGFSQLATFQSISDSSNGLSRTATYQITAPNGVWDATTNGTYAISIVANSGIVNTVGGTVAPVQLGTFVVSLQSVSLQGSVLNINGTSRSDTIEVLLVPGSSSGVLDTIEVLLNNVAKTFGRTFVSSVVINGLGGNDTIRVRKGIPAALITTGAGNDTIVTSNANDTIHGGGGRDYIQVGTGSNVIYTDTGKDTVLTGNGVDYVVVGTKKATIMAGSGVTWINSNDGHADTIVRGTGKVKAYVDDLDVIVGNTGTLRLLGSWPFAI